MPPETVAPRLWAEERDRLTLCARAAFCEGAGDRRRAETPDPIRTAFQRDRDRILHAKPFRRLKHKTQVFIAPRGDHYRTRLTHTLEVSGVARTIARALRLNEDLTEAIALGHDVGHTPFGHAGERALDEAIRERGGDGFSHSEQSLRIVDTLLDLNLTRQTRGGIAGHSKGRADLSAKDGQVKSTLEAAVVRISDRVAYLAHDVDDAIRSGLIGGAPDDFLALGENHAARIGGMVADVIAHSVDRDEIRMSETQLERMNRLKEWMFENVYLEYPRRFPEVAKAEGIVRELFHHYADDPARLPAGYAGFQGAIDFVAGMTDRFAIELFSELRVPRAWHA